jgi:hypothetical protein
MPVLNARRKTMNEETVETTNEFEFSKTKGFGSMNYGVISSKIVLHETDFTIENKSRWFFFIKGKGLTETIPYESLDSVEVKTNFAKGDLISGIIIFLIALFTSQYWGLLFVAMLVFCSYSKNIVISKKNSSSKITILSEGIGENETIAKFCAAIEKKR